MRALVACICLYIVFLTFNGCGSADNSEANFDNLLTGVWIIAPIDDTITFFESNGAGLITDHGFFNATPSGTYSVESNGAFSMTTNVPSFIEGELTSERAGIITAIDSTQLIPAAPISKISDISALFGNFSGILTETCSGDVPQLCDGTTYEIDNLIVDERGTIEEGIISDSIDVFTVQRGVAYRLGNKIIIYVYTDISNESLEGYSIIKITGIMAGPVISGVYEINSSISGPIGIALVSFTPSL